MLAGLLNSSEPRIHRSNRFLSVGTLQCVCVLIALVSLAQAGGEPAQADEELLREAIAQAELQREAATHRLKTTETKLQQLQAQLRPLQHQLGQARQHFDDSQQTRQQGEEGAEAATGGASNPGGGPQSETARHAAGEQLKSLRQRISALTAEIGATQARVDRAAANAVELTETWVARQQQMALVLKQRGEWISFASDVAPILASRCLACHDARTAKGQLSVNSYAALLRGGESGAVVEPRNAADSLLCQLIEDGSMPEDADPLTESQVTKIRQWVTLGATLDAGVDAEAPLIGIMPKLSHPPAPEAYPRPLPVTAIAISPDGTQFATSGYHEVLLWNSADARLLQRIGNVAERIYDLEFHPDGRRLAVAAGSPGRLGEVKVIDAVDGTMLADLVTLGDVVLGVAFSPDGDQLAAAAADRTIRLFDVTTGEPQHVIEDHADWVMSVAFSPDGTKLASASRDKTAKVFDTSLGEALLTFNGHGDIVYDVGFLADGQRMVSCGRDRKLRLWNTETGDEQRAMAGWEGDILQLEVLPDDHVLACSSDQTVRRFNVSDGSPVQTYNGHRDWVYAIAAHPESSRLIAGSYNGEVRIWNLARGELLTSLMAAPGLSLEPHQSAP